MVATSTLHFSYPFISMPTYESHLNERIIEISKLPDKEYRKKLKTTCWVCGEDVFSGKTCSECFAKGLNAPTEHAAIAAKKKIQELAAKKSIRQNPTEPFPSNEYHTIIHPFDYGTSVDGELQTHKLL